MPSSGSWRADSWRFGQGSGRAGRAGVTAARGRRVRYKGAAPLKNWPLWVAPLVLSLCGILMIASLTSGSAPGGSLYGAAAKQCRFLGLGLLLMFCCYLTPLSVVRHYSGLLWFAAMLMAAGTLIPGIGVKVGGARRWLNLLGFQFQPLEILTLAVPLFLADRLTASKRQGFQCFCRPTLSVAFLSALPLFFQPNMGGIILVFALCMSMHVVNRGWKYPLTGAAFLFFTFSLMIYVERYRWERFLAFLNPWAAPTGRGFQIIQGLVAFSNGGIFGVGVGKGLQKMDYLPAAHTDYIFPAIGEEFGLIGTLFVLALYVFWTYKVYHIYQRVTDPYLATLIWGVAASVLFPMFLNLGGVMKLTPLTGIPLPFLSAGGSAMVAMWIKVGILMHLGKEINKGQAP